MVDNIIYSYVIVGNLSIRICLKRIGDFSYLIFFFEQHLQKFPIAALASLKPLYSLPFY